MATIKPGSRDYWGPMVWRMYHLCANVSSSGTIRLWQHVLRSTSYAMPCEKCREHMTHYLDTHSLKDVDMRKYVWELHNSVNLRNERPLFSYDDLVATYAYKDHNETLLEIKKLFTAIQEAWKSTTHVMCYPKAFCDWRKYVTMLIATL